MDQYTITIHPTGRVVVNGWPGTGQLMPHLYEQIQCSVTTPIELGTQLTMWCDDEGLIAAAPELNQLATKLCALYGPLRCYLVGIVVLTGPADRTGHTLPLGPAAVAVLADILDTVADLPMPQLVD